MASQLPMLFNHESKADCREAVRLLKKERVIALDSEGVQLGKDGPLTLLQVGTVDGRVYLFDVMKNEKEQDKGFFKDTGLDDILTATDIVKVIQSCSGDSAALYYQFDIRLENVFDTQVAHLVIQEHKGRRLPSRIKLAEICSMYSEKATVYEGKEDVKIEWVKRVGNFWAKRPMTKEMIEYASGDVTALIPEVYETQKRDIEENGLNDLFTERVQEEIEYHLDPDIKERRKERNLAVATEILKEMATKYRDGIDLSSLSDEDETKALKDTAIKELTDLPDVIKTLKLQSMESFLKSIQEQLEEPETFNPDRGLLYKLNDIGHCGSQQLETEATRIKRHVVEVMTNDITEKYIVDTPLENLSSLEYQIIRDLKLLLDDEPQFSSTVQTLHWKIAEKEITAATEELNGNPDYSLKISIARLNVLNKNPGVPENIKYLAGMLLARNESMVIDRVVRRSNKGPMINVDELSDAERMVIEKLRVSNQLPPVVVALHWQIAEKEVSENVEGMKADPNHQMTMSISKLKFLMNNDGVPSGLKKMAQSLHTEYESATLARISQKYSRGSRVNELTDAEKTVLERLKLSSGNFPPTVVYLHWAVIYEKLNDDLEKYQKKEFSANDGFKRKLNFLKNDRSVPTDVKQKAIEFLRELPQGLQASRNRGRRY